MPRKATIPIYDGDDFERLAELRRAVDIAERNKILESAAPLRGGDEVPSDEAVESAKAAYDAFVDEAAERAETWVLQAIGHGDFRDLLKAHPAREVDGEPDESGTVKKVTHPDDEGFDVNTETFGLALLMFADVEDEDHRTVVEPFTTPAALAKRLKRLSAGEFDTLWSSALMLNRGGISDPRAGKYSTTRTSDAT